MNRTRMNSVQANREGERAYHHRLKRNLDSAQRLKIVHRRQDSERSFSDHSLTPPYQSGDKDDDLDHSDGADDSSSCKSTISSELVKGHASFNSNTGIRNSPAAEAVLTKSSSAYEGDPGTGGVAKGNLSNGEP